MKKFIPFIVLAGITIFFFYQTFFFGKIPFPGDLLLGEYKPWSTYSYFGYNPGAIPNKAQYFDTIRQLYPWKTLTMDLWKTGEFPLWNPYNFSGAPLLANHQSQALYPLNIIYLFLSYPWAWAVTVILQTFLASLFTYLYCRKIKFSTTAALFSGLVFAYSQFMSVFLEYNTIGHTLLYLPLALYFVEKLSGKKSWASFVGLTMSLSFSFLAGHLQLFLLSLMLIFLYSIARAKSAIFVILLSFVTTFALCAAQLLPTLELMINSARSNQEYRFLIEKLLIQPHQLIRFFIPDIFGNPATRNYLETDTYPGKAMYIGLIPLFFASLIFLKRHKNTLERIFVTTTIIVLLFIVRSPATEFFYRFPVPFFSSSSPTNALFLVSFALSLLAGFGLDSYIHKAENTKFRHGVLLCLGLFTVLLLFVIGKNVAINNRSIVYSSVLSLTLIGILIINRRIKKDFLACALILFVGIIDLWYGFQKFNPFGPEKYVFPPSTVFTWLGEHGDINRFWGYGAANIEANFATQYRIFSPDGYDPLYPRWYGEFIRASSDGKLARRFTNQTRSDAVIQQGFGELDFSQNEYRKKILRLLGVRYILDRTENGSTTRTFDPNEYSLVYDQDEWKIFEDKKSLPRTFLVSNTQRAQTMEEFEEIFSGPDFNPTVTAIVSDNVTLKTKAVDDTEKATMTSYTPNEAVIDVTSAAERLLVLSDTFYPGWQAFVDNNQTKIVRTNWAFRGVLVPSGNHTVRFVYKPVSFEWGLKISAMTFIIIAIPGLFLLIRKR